MPFSKTPFPKAVRWAAVLIALSTSTAVLAQETITVEVDPVECLEIAENGVAWSTVDNNIPDTEVRLYFRRMHEAVEDLYWVPMHPDGNGRYWGMFPKPEDQEIQRNELIERRTEAQEQYAWAQWWREKEQSEDRNPTDDLDQDLIRERASQGKLENRDWLAKMSDSEFQDWLETLENEPAEYYSSVHDHTGKAIAKSETRVTEVKDGCRSEPLTAKQLGEAENLTVGETAYWQRGEELFHWLCDGIVSRVDTGNIERGDEICRACVVAWWKNGGLLLPAAGVGAGVVAGVLILDDDDPAPASPSTP